MNAQIRVGTASWTDPGFVLDWYPKNLPKSRMLEFYAHQFDFVEVNSTFYSIPNSRVVEGWSRQTPEGFLFDVKLFKLLSRHSTETKFLPPDLRPLAGGGEKVALHPELERRVIERFLQEIQPLRRDGKLGAFLLQLSPGFRPKTNDLSELANIFELFSREKLAVELRNRDWMNGKQKDETINYFREKRVSLVTVDAPKGEHFTIMPFSDVVTNPGLAYWRFHGRNEEAFVKGRTVAERFDYEYSYDELKEIAEKIQRMSKNAEELHLIFNNNRSNYAPKAAAQLLQILQQNRDFNLSVPKKSVTPKAPSQPDLKLDS